MITCLSYGLYPGPLFSVLQELLLGKQLELGTAYLSPIGCGVDFRNWLVTGVCVNCCAHLKHLRVKQPVAFEADL